MCKHRLSIRIPCPSASHFRIAKSPNKIWKGKFKKLFPDMFIFAEEEPSTIMVFAWYGYIKKCEVVSLEYAITLFANQLSMGGGAGDNWKCYCCFYFHLQTIALQQNLILLISYSGTFRKGQNKKGIRYLLDYLCSTFVSMNFRKLYCSMCSYRYNLNWESDTVKYFNLFCISQREYSM